MICLTHANLGQELAEQVPDRELHKRIGFDRIDRDKLGAVEMVLSTLPTGAPPMMHESKLLSCRVCLNGFWSVIRPRWLSIVAIVSHT